MSLVDAIPQTIKQIGAAKARGLAGGGAWGNAVADVGQLIGQLPAQMAVKKSRDMQAAMQAAELAKIQRDQAADTALQNATASSLNPDGTLNTSLLTQHLAGTPAASRIPVILEQFNRMQETAANVRLKTIDAQEAEDDILGSLAHASAQAENPDDRAGILAAGLASAQRTGTVRPERAKDVLSSILTPDGKPDGTKVDALVKQLTAASKTQRTLAESEARASALNADRQAQEDVRTEQLRQTKLRNLSSQLGSATSQADYARRYQGVPEDMRGYFDAPDAWTPDTAQRALGVALTPAERLSIQTQDRLAKQAQATADRQAETDRRLEAAQKETERHNRATEAAAAAREARERSGGGDDKKEDAAYKLFVSQYDKARTEERERAPKTASDPNNPFSPMVSNAPAYQPPPSLEKWRAMTPAERASVLRDPNARINDAELQRRVSGGSAPPVAAPVAPKLQVGQVVSVRGKKVKVSAVHADGSFDGDEVR